MNERERQFARPTTAEIASSPARTTEEVRDAGKNLWARKEEEARTPLFPEEELTQLRAKWSQIQSEFVDEPRRSVEEADSLVASTIKRLAGSFAGARTNLERQWARGGDVSTEDLRMALRRYRSFFDRLLAV